MDKVTLIINKKDCMGCHACEVACKQEHQLGVGPRLVQVIEKISEYVPIYCHHCAKPPCKEACPVEAIFRNEQGIVLIKDDLCIGCRDCIQACPFGAMQFDENSEVALKCDLCVDRLSENKEPACVSVCPTRCIRFQEEKSIATVFEEGVQLELPG